MAAANGLVAGAIPVPNGSFESPATVFVETNIASWIKSPKPFWYDENANGPWDQLTGVFLNTPPGDPSHIVNCDGAQAAFLFALPGVALSQDSFSSSNTVVKFEPGKSYQLTVGVLGNGGGMTNGVTLLIGLYYLDKAGNAITIAATTITNSSTLFPGRTNLVDFQAQLPPVKAADAWAEKTLGVQIVSTVDFSLVGGYWDVDNVRLVSTQAPVLSVAASANGQFNLSLLSEPGLNFEVLASTNAAAAASDWSSVGTVTNLPGCVTFTVPPSELSQRFFRVKQLP